MGTRAIHPTAQALLGWMQARPERLRALLADEARDGGDFSPAGDAAVRAHLRFVAEALAAIATGPSASALEDFAAGLDARLDASEDELQEQGDLIAEATAFEVDRQFGTEARDDPSMAAMLERRIRIGAWTRVFLAALDDALPGREPIAPRALDWMGSRQTLLADTIFAMDRRAKQVEIDRGGADAVADAGVVNRIGQAAMLQAHSRFLVEALAESL